ncbi:MAG: hypothetical protein SFU25_08520 [Candidatus Caenarcaniphilales bacterium]|nr:hypothetical protein [Candidatus Caenarcaniphilales bacterium]
MESNLKNQSEEETRESENQRQEEEDWTLDTIKGDSYLEKRKPFFADEVYKFGAGFAALLAITALLANHFVGK